MQRHLRASGSSFSPFQRFGRRRQSARVKGAQRRLAFDHNVAEMLERRMLLSTAIVSGQTIAGSITAAGQQVTYTFTAAAGNTFDISLGDATAASALRPYLQVFAPDGTTRVINAATGATNTSVSGIYTVPAAAGGTYTAIVKDDAATATGAYDLELVVAPATQVTDSNGDGGSIVSGQTKAGTINRTGDLDVFTFSATAHSTFDISLGDANNASAVNPYLQVFDPTGARVINTASGSTNTSVSGIYTVPAASAGTYTAIVQDSGGDSTGAYDLEVDVAPATQAVDSNGDGGAIVSGQTKAGTISRTGDLDVFTFSAAANHTFDISLGDDTAASAVNPYLQVFDPTGARVINTASGATNISVSGIYTVPAAGAGTYTVIVQDNGGNSTGTYDLEVDVAPATQAADSNSDGGAIASGQTKAGTINRTGDLDVFTFSALAGNTFDISLGDASAASAVNPYLQVFDPTGARVINTASGATNISVSGIYTVPAASAGIYTVIVQDNGGDSTGAYNLELAVAPATQAADSNGDGGMIVSGQTKAGTINRTGDLDVFTFSASAGKTFDISLGDDTAASAVNPYLQVFDPTGARVINTASGATNISVSGIYTVPAAGAGVYTVIVQDNGGNATGTYDLELAVAPAIQATDSNSDGGVITGGQTKAGTINRTGDLDIFTFSATVGDVFTVLLADASAASAVNPYLQVFGPTGARIINTASGAVNTSVSGKYTVPAGGNGAYTIIVQDNGGDSTGAYNLSLSGTLHPRTLTLTGPAAQTASTGVAKSFTLGSFAANNSTGPFTVDVNWGDGTADTVFSVSAAGTIPAQSHTYATAGAKTASLVVVDANADVSNRATFGVTVSSSTDVAPTATLSAAPVSLAGSITYSFTVTYADADGTPVKFSTLDINDVKVITPGNVSITPTTAVVNTTGDGTPRTVTYTITPPGGFWDGADIGLYSIALQANQVSDTAGHFTAAKTLGSFAVDVNTATLPTATLSSAPAVTTAGGTSYTFTVTYADNVAIHAASIGAGDVTVTGLNNVNIPVTFVSVNNSADGTPRIATYKITPPGGAWAASANGTYTIKLLGNQVTDAVGNYEPPKTLGTFTVNVPAAAVVTPRVFSSSPIRTAPGTDSMLWDLSSDLLG